MKLCLLNLQNEILLFFNVKLQLKKKISASDLSPRVADSRWLRSKICLGEPGSYQL